MYKNTQFAWVIWAILLWLSSFLAVATQLMGFNVGVLGFALLLLIVAIAFYGLTIKVDITQQTISWWFGPGVGKKTLRFDDISYVSPTRNSFRHGVGMRISNDGWVYSAAGFNALEIVLKDGLKYRIGTNDQDNLLKNIPEQLVKLPVPSPSNSKAKTKENNTRKKRKDPFDFN